MGSSKLHLCEGLSGRQTATVLAAIAIYLVFQATVVGLKPMHVVLAAAFAALYFPHPATRRLSIALLPFVIFAVTYDWMRLYPNYQVNPIDIRGLHDAELSLFGISAGGGTITPNEYFNLHHNAVADFLAGCFYLCWVPVPVAFGLMLYLKGEKKMYLHFAVVFLLVNWLGFIGYYIHPAAPPWYVINYGYEPILNTPGNMAGLARFDQLVGMPIFESIYVNNANIFAALPSLHAAYMLITTIYAALSRRSIFVVALFACITAGIWWTAVYSGHHYVIDVLLGIATAIIGILLFEKVLMRTAVCRRFFEYYERNI